MDSGQLDSIIRIAEAVDKFGSLVIVFAAFMFLSVGIIVLVMQRWRKLAKGQDEQNKIMFQRFLENGGKPAPPEIVTETITNTGVTRKHLKDAVGIAKADRASVYAFHDNQRMVNSHHMLKLSCWAEYPMLPQFARAEKHRDMQSSRFQELCEALLKYKRWEALTEEELEGTELATWGEGEYSIKSAFAHAIYSTDLKLLGFILIEYVQLPVYLGLIEKAREECRKLSDKVSIILDVEFK